MVGLRGVAFRGFDETSNATSTFRFSFVSELMQDLYGRLSLHGNYIDGYIIVIVDAQRAFNIR